MANKEHLDLLKRGVEAWNSWRNENLDIEPNLSDADLSGLDLSKANFSKANIQGTNFTDTNLNQVDFSNVKTGISSASIAMALSSTKVLFARGSGFLIVSIFWTISSYFLPEYSNQANIFLMLLVPVIIIFLMFWLLHKIKTYWLKNAISLLFGGLTTGMFTMLFVGRFRLDLISAVFESLQIMVVALASGFILVATFSMGFEKSSLELISESFRNGVLFTNIALFIAICGQSIETQFEASSQESIPYELLIRLISDSILVSDSGKRFIFTALSSIYFVYYLPKVAIKILEGDGEFSKWTKGFSTAFGATASTTFEGANLTGTNFDSAELRSADFREATLTNVCWFNAQLGNVRFEKTILADPDVLELLITGKGKAKKPQKKNLKGAYLMNTDLEDADLTEIDVSGAILKGANLKGTNLTKVQALNTDFSQSLMTGASGLGTWKIDDKTKVDNIECQYVFLSFQQVDNQLIEILPQMNFLNCSRMLKGEIDL